ncbi:hypothetical protein SAPIO_CDS7724 [Scedosporium apiospermum]|uniref:EXPERA domain-containing protein n=1 Tax=Pseudallescheria apiosperma TaxID=563466 RepID=A0A084G2J5_PSEDA|nr:uncharacterized protein SAPIO_CDS7724 [Scedosporium apiospermum]KEZ41557.1 hypothetical protein SAPIO_CDS7724 [Scedosporium apiospermum]
MPAYSPGNSRPGPNFATDQKGRSPPSSPASAASCISVESAVETVHSIESSPSIKELASQLNGDLEKLSRTVQDLEKWFEQLNSDGYKRRLPWTDAMQRAFKRYKGLVDKHTRAHQAFENYFLTTKGSNSKKNATAEDHVERAQLALEWGRAALKAGEARADFMEMYRKAYKLDGIQGHIQAVENCVNSAQDAVEEAQKNYDTLLLSIVAVGSAGVASRRNPKLSINERLIVSWYSICGFLHCFFEGYFVLNHANLASQQTLFAQLWKEYSLSDSRYLTSDPFMLSVETITVLVWGPLCFFSAWCIIRESTIRYPVQMMVCMGHLYGVILYYATSAAEQYYRGNSHSRPEFQYFWLYYVGFNLPWVIVPSFLLLRSIRAMRVAFAMLGRVRGLLTELRGSIHDINQRKNEEEASASQSREDEKAA